MIEYWPESLRDDRAIFEQFRSAIQTQSTDVRFAVIGGNLLVVGTVGTYAEKAQIDAAAESYGLAIQNAVRVVPGRDWLAPGSVQLAG